MLSLQKYNLTNKLTHFSFLKKIPCMKSTMLNVYHFRKKDNPALWTVKIKTL